MGAGRGSELEIARLHKRRGRGRRRRRRAIPSLMATNNKSKWANDL